jgi:hypothetical protein
VVAQAVAAVQMEVTLVAQELLVRVTLVDNQQVIARSVAAVAAVHLLLEQLVQLLALAVLVAALFQLGLRLLQLAHLVRMRAAVAVGVGIIFILEQTLAVLEVAVQVEMVAVKQQAQQTRVLAAELLAVLVTAT